MGNSEKLEMRKGQTGSAKSISGKEKDNEKKTNGAMNETLN